MNKYQLLNAFIDQYKHLPSQGTDEWKALRENFIGGSEVSTILKQNKNKTISKLVLGKLGFDSFHGNVITHWGNVFEEMIRLHCEDEFSCSILETGSIPYKHGSLSYSPDGLAVIPTNILKRKFGTLTKGLSISNPNQLVLFEFKCPHSRVPSQEIPDNYWPQVNIGMNIIDIMETAIFVQATYRRCAFKSLKYDRQHNACGHYKRADLTNPPIECGFMVVYTESDIDYEGLTMALLDIGEATEIHLSNGHVVIDLGNVSDIPLLEEVLGNCVNKTFKVDYCFRQKYNQEVFRGDEYKIGMYNESLQYRANRELQHQTIKHSNIIGIIPFKLLNVHMTPVAKNPNYIEETGAHQKAIDVLQCIKDHKETATKAEVMKSVRQYKL